MWRLNKTLLKKMWVKKKSEKFKKYFELKEIESTTYQNLCNVVNTLLRWKYIALNA